MPWSQPLLPSQPAHQGNPREARKDTLHPTFFFMMHLSVLACPWQKINSLEEIAQNPPTTHFESHVVQFWWSLYSKCTWRVLLIRQVLRRSGNFSAPEPVSLEAGKRSSQFQATGGTTQKHSWAPQLPPSILRPRKAPLDEAYLGLSRG